jgi:outer membrane protein assembly factor BamE (lipoprotein component of BamABCDE complex)
MKCFSQMALLPVILLAGCTHYANVDQVHKGMTVDQVLAIDTPCYYRGESGQIISYNCEFSVLYKNHKSIKPYILTFKDGKLARIAINEKALTREALEDQYYDNYPWFYGPYPWGAYYFDDDGDEEEGEGDED